MKSLLDHPLAYLSLQAAIGAKRARKTCLEQYAKPTAGERVLDVGCGPGFVCEYLPEVEYIGIDIDRRYIEYAQQKYGDRAEFHCLELTSQSAAQFGEFDLVLLNGVLHHLDDQHATTLLELTRNCLKDTGRLMTLDGCYGDATTYIKRWLLQHDRGRYIRKIDAYASLAQQVFADTSLYERSDLFWVPYDALVMVCRKSVAGVTGSL